MEPTLAEADSIALREAGEFSLEDFEAKETLAPYLTGLSKVRLRLSMLDAIFALD